jgi:2-polyprenyl-6-methoxyphenol hydroxylase-like FAD-dependent oxidoreductase
MSDTVIVVGGGAVGLMLAHELGLAGVDTVVLDQNERQREDAPGLALNSGVIELLTQRGLVEQVVRDYIEVPIAHFAHLWLEPARLSERHPFTYGVPQAHLERCLAEAVTKLGVEIRRGHRVEEVSQDEHGVTVRARTESGVETITGAWVVGCDGARSTVRELAGIEFAGTDNPFYGLTGDVEVEQGAELFSLLQPNFYPDGALTVVPGEPEVIRVLSGQSTPAPGARLRLRVLTGEFDRTPPDPEAPPTVDELRQRIAHITGKEYDLGTPRWLSRWYHVVRQATEYRRGRVLLAGDAAHTHFPLGGQAMSTGLEDAVNLGWKLAATVHGWAPETLLDTYHDERHPVGARALLTTQAQVSLLHPWSRALPLRELLTELIRHDYNNEYFVRMVGGLDVRYPIEYAEAPTGRHSLTGLRLHKLDLTVAGDTVSSPELLTGGRGVLLDLSGGALPVEKLAGWADRVDVVQASTSDTDAKVVLLRPDGRVAWAGTDTDVTGPLAALATWFGAAKVEG